MLTISRIKAEMDHIKERMKVRGFSSPELLDQAVALDDKRRAIQQENDAALAEANALAREIGELYKKGQREEAEAAKARSGELKARTGELGDALKAAEEELREVLLHIPNVPHDLVPPGRDESDNVLIREGGVKPEFDFKPLPHWELAARHDLIDFELGVKLAGAGFPVYKGAGARLQRALISWFLDRATAAGYTEYTPAMVVNEASAYGTGQLPDKDGQMYELADDKLFLVPTAEVSLTNIYRDVILSEGDFPVRMTGYSSCFRREAGSYGKEVRGLNRLHQFEKVEIVQIAHPSRSYEVLDSMVAYVEGLLVELGLPYRIVRLCGGDTSFASAMTYDFEVWSAGQERWLEVSSVSNFETFQANRLKLRYADGDNKKHLCHTLNGSALALPRIVAALLENGQTGDGINLPSVLNVNI